jgi:hypothetical protein
MASDCTNGSTTVQISGQEVMLKDKSYYKKSMGDEAGCAPKKGLLTSVNRGKVYFKSWSMDVKFEGENVDRFLDLTTNNHASEIGATPPFPDLDDLEVGGVSCKKILAKEKILVHRHNDKDCPEGYQSDHILQNACFENERGTGGITACPDYSVGDAPCICLKGESTTEGTQHYIKTQAQNEMAAEWKASGSRTVPYREVRDRNLQAVSDSRSKPPSDDAMECLKLVVDHYFKEKLGLREKTPVRTPASGTYRRPPGTLK